MSTLKDVKKQEYKKILQEEITNVTDDILEEIIEYLYALANIEVSILELNDYEKKNCNLNGESIQ